jgi:hypothetical protein
MNRIIRTHDGDFDSRIGLVVSIHLAIWYPRMLECQPREPQDVFKLYFMPPRRREKKIGVMDDCWIQ